MVQGESGRSKSYSSGEIYYKEPELDGMSEERRTGVKMFKSSQESTSGLIESSYAAVDPSAAPFCSLESN